VFDVSPLEFIVLAGFALLIFGPERLPGMAAQAGRWLRQFREMATGAQKQLTNSLGPEFAESGIVESVNELRSLDPRRAIVDSVTGLGATTATALNTSATVASPKVVPPSVAPSAVVGGQPRLSVPAAMAAGEERARQEKAEAERAAASAAQMSEASVTSDAEQAETAATQPKSAFDDMP